MDTMAFYYIVKLIADQMRDMMAFLYDEHDEHDGLHDETGCHGKPLVVGDRFVMSVSHLT